MLSGLDAEYYIYCPMTLSIGVASAYRASLGELAVNAMTGNAMI